MLSLKPTYCGVEVTADSIYQTYGADKQAASQAKYHELQSSFLLQLLFGTTIHLQRRKYLERGLPSEDSFVRHFIPY